MVYHRGPRVSRHPEKKYLDGLGVNLPLMADLYPGWTLRLYHDVAEGEEEMDKVCAVACSSPALDLCRVTELPSKKVAARAQKLMYMIWRFLPTMDPQVGVIV